MLTILRRSGRGIATTTYPEVADPAPLAFRGQILLLTDRCNGDSACARICPSDAIAVTGSPHRGWTWVLDDARCVFCALCAEACPSDALLVTHDYELAARDRRELIAHADVAPRTHCGSAMEPA